jgi:hypothetical protein
MATEAEIYPRAISSYQACFVRITIGPKQGRNRRRSMSSREGYY